MSYPRVMEFLPGKPKPEDVKLLTGQDEEGWYAYDDASYCGCGECEGGTLGRGATEAEAVQDFYERLKP